MNDTPHRPIRAETPPADHWRRWASDDTTTTAHAATASQTALEVAAAAFDAGADNADALSAADAPYRILIVEDDRPQALFAQSVLHGAGMLADVTGDAEGVLAAIGQQCPDLILMDLHLPGVDGMRLTAMIRQLPGMQLLPIVFLSGDPDPERQFEVLDSGADDYLSKPIRPRHLVAAVSNRIRRARAQAAIGGGQPAVPSLHNPETGLPTRQHVLAQLGATLAHHEPGGLAFIEVSSALGLRERYGYAAFERLMVQAAQRLAEIAQPHLLARLNDNSFLVLVRSQDEDGLDVLARRLRDALSERPFLIRDEESVHLRGVVGYAPLSPGFEDTHAALEAVERTALQARLLSSGVAVHTSTAAATAQEHLALLDGQIEVAYQPIVAVRGGGLAQYQLLLRLRQADGRLLTAGQVIPAAEAAGRIADLDQQVVEHALGLLDLYRHADPALHLFVSQSPITLGREAFADWLLESLQQRNLQGHALVIDVRLQDALIHTVPLQQFFARASAMGVRCCLSQFEPGTEANALLHHLPLSFLRLSARFSNGQTDSPRDELRAVIELAAKAKLQLIGQQIEDPQAAAVMWGSGVDFIQGNMVQSVGSKLDFDFVNTVL